MKTSLLTVARLSTLALLLLGSPHFSVAAHTPNPVRQETQTYIQQQVLPVVRQQRLKLDAQLSAADRAQVAECRAQLSSLQKQQREFRRSLQPAGAPKGQRPELTEAQRQQARDLREARQKVEREVKQLAKKYEPQIQALAAEVQPQREKWTTDLQAIRQKYTQPDASQPLDSKPQKQRLSKPDAQFTGTRFLLFDPAASARSSASAVLSAPGRMSVYPNPIEPRSQVQYDVPKSGSVLIELLDSRGTTLRTLLQAEQEKGSHTFDLPTQDLSRGTYYLKITTRTGTETQRFVKN
ncbi:T9SS type A sorting domain-containing protein [Hymenobacter guriensis]|uniref:T9SS type A sorting domain-containing protein n=1 Tax=Hymenobacter guriensis TaxID=2793065 RepID=A0ABS0KX22_9BACT|nr:T9SS type A sorting domain-containing protein [Hymenobacter guriensis]MBG8552413.1 T9SS type A sorting domain-containing protein [Hymenobacter guriensis]